MDHVRQVLQCENPSVDGAGVRIAVLDTGVDLEHPDLAGALDLEESRSFCISRSVMDTHGHGTHVAGIIAGSGELSDGRYAGLAPKAELIILRVGTDMRSSAHEVAAAVLHAVELGVDIINYSAGQYAWGSGPPPWKWPGKLGVRDLAFQHAIDSGILCVAAAGNDGPAAGTVVRPGNLTDVLCAGALAPPSYAVAEASGRGPVYLDSTLKNSVARVDQLVDLPSSVLKPDLVATGGVASLHDEALTRILTSLGISPMGVASTRSRGGGLLGLDPADPDHPYARLGGTSQATAVVTGLAALLLDLGRRSGMDWGSNQGKALREVLRHSAVSLATGTPDDFGRGALLWPIIVGTLSDCIASPVRRATVMEGIQLRLEP